METKTVKAKVKNLIISPQKLRLVIDVVRGLDAQKALETLEFLNKKGAKMVLKAIASGVASGKELHKVEAKDLIISHISVDEGKISKKPRFASRGRFSYLTKRRSYINLELTVK
jgi:large subunit ribosomal protein L22